MFESTLEHERVRVTGHSEYAGRLLTDAFAAGGTEANRAFAAMRTMGKIDVAAIAARDEVTKSENSHVFLRICDAKV